MNEDTFHWDWFELRFSDFSLSPEQESLVESFKRFFAKEVPSSRVRASEPLGFDAALWDQLRKMGALSMAAPSAMGGSDAGLVEAALVAEEHGVVLAPTPFVEHVVATRLLARSDGPSTLMTAALDGTRIVTLALSPLFANRRQMVPAGALANDVLALDGDRLVVLTRDVASPLVPNQGSAPLAFWEVPDTGRTSVATLAVGQEAIDSYRLALDEWRILTASALVGLTDRALSIAVEFAKTRYTLGVPVGSLQGVAFPLADVAIGVAGARNLTRKAAWYMDNEPGIRPDLAWAAFATASQVATRGTVTAQHAQGGLGFTLEGDAGLYFLRSKGWSLLGGDPADAVNMVGDLLVDKAMKRADSGSTVEELGTR